MKKDVFFFGAGFSRFLVPGMPLMYDLGESIIKQNYLRELYPPEFIKTKNVESFMSYLNEEYPFESESQFLRKQAAFRDVSKFLADMIGSWGTVQEDFQDEAILLGKSIFKNNSSVITLNYDLLFESLLGRVMGFEGKIFSHIESYPAPFSLLSARTGAAIIGRTPIVQPKIFKLHGSINWFYSGRTNYYGESIYVAMPSTKIDLRADKVPLIIPPTYSKTSYFNNETIRHLWSAAAKEIVLADRLILFGYSFPSSDSVVKTTLQNCIRPGAKITIVNPSQEVAERVKNYFPDCDVDLFTDPNEFVRKYAEK